MNLILQLSIKPPKSIFEIFFLFFYRASLCNLFQKKPTRCTLLLSIFISTSLHVSGNYAPIIRRTYCICATLVFFTLYRWLYRPIYLELLTNVNPLKCSSNSMYHHDVQQELCILPLTVRL